METDAEGWMGRTVAIQYVAEGVSAHGMRAAVSPQAEETARLLPWAREAEDAALREPPQHSKVLLLHAQARGVQAGPQRARRGAGHRTRR